MYLLQLLEETGLAGYVKQPTCDKTAGVYTGATNGWTKGKYIDRNVYEAQHSLIYGIVLQNRFILQKRDFFYNRNYFKNVLCYLLLSLQCQRHLTDLDL